MAAETVLIVEDDPTMQRGLKDNFEFEGYTVRTADDGERGLAEARAAKPDLIILDIMLPKINGYEVCRLLRKEGVDTPVIMLTAKGQESDIVLGLNIGADDYMTKPFSIQELLARANAFLRRKRRSEAAAYRFDDFELNGSSRRLTRNGHEIVLTPKEFGVLAHLIKRAGRAITRDEILRVVWGIDVRVTARSVDRCINTLRGKIEPDIHEPVYIATVRDIGYRFEMPGLEELA